MKVITDNNFQEILASGQIVLIDFWATWCGPCRVLSPTVDEVAEDFQGKAIVAKCNVDDAEDVAGQFGVRNIPTLIFLKDGEVAARLVGLVSKEEIEEILNSLI